QTEWFERGRRGPTPHRVKSEPHFLDPAWGVGAPGAHPSIRHSIAEKTLEARRRQLGVAQRVLNGLLAEIGLNSPRIDSVIRQLVAARMAKHVRVHLDIEAGSLCCPIHHCLKAPYCERRAALADEHERRFRLLFAFQAPQGA